MTQYYPVFEADSLSNRDFDNFITRTFPIPSHLYSSDGSNKTYRFPYFVRAIRKAIEWRKKMSSMKDVEILKYIFEHTKQFRAV